jgi:hypothetical protein
MMRLAKRVGNGIRRVLRRENGERGQAYMEVLVLLPLYLVLIVGAAYFGRAWYAKIAAEMASYSGTRTAIEAMGEPRGTWQGIIAARQTLAGFYLDPSHADVRVVPLDVWGRGQAVRCDVRYRVDLSGLPLIDWISADPVLPVWARSVGQVEAYKSEW